MRTQTLDTSPEVERVQFRILAKMPAWQKVRSIFGLNRLTHHLFIVGQKKMNPELTPEDLHKRFVHKRLGNLADRIPEDKMKLPYKDDMTVFEEVCRKLESLGLPYFITGSIAASIHGEIRSTNDADIVISIGIEQVDSLILAFAIDYYIDERMIHEAILRRRSFNVIHFGSSFKIDFYVPQKTPFFESQLRRVKRTVLFADSSQAYPVISAEDLILSKLLWFQKGDCISDQQWRDILGMLKTKQEGLDFGYLSHWAVALGVKELLEKTYADGLE